MSEEYKLKYLTGRKLKTFLAIADRIIPSDEDSPGAGQMQTAGVVDWALERMPEGLRKQFLLLISAFELLGILFGGRPFSKNSEKARDRQLAWFESAPIQPLRMGFFGLKSYVCMGYYTREDIWKTLNYDGPLLPDRPYADPVVRKLCQDEMKVSS